MNEGRLKPEGYMSRIADIQLSKMLDVFGAVEVAGTMWCGKTWTSRAYGESESKIGQTAARLAAEADPETALLGAKPHVIDEWQDVPAIWDTVRASVDEADGKNGMYILTGSSEPKKDEVKHSGAGRIGKMRMRTMSLAETGESSARVSLKDLFEGKFNPASVQQKLAPLAQIICRGGWPAVIKEKSMDTSMLLESYFDALFEVNIPRKNLKGNESRRVAQALARNIGHALTLKTIAADAQFPDPDSSQATTKVSEHISALENLYAIECIRGWDAPIRSKTRLRTKPKYYFADPSLVASLLGITPERLIEDGQLFGLLFESQVMHDLAVYTGVLPGASHDSLHYYRDSDGLEVDAIIELRSGQWAGFEIKLGENKWKDGAKALNRLRKKVGANPAARNPKPEFMAVIVGAGEAARYDKEEDVYIIPLTALGA